MSGRQMRWHAGVVGVATQPGAGGCGLLEAAPDAVIAVRPDGRIALVNAQAERLFGYDRRELFDHPVEMLVPEAARAMHSGHRERYLADPRPRPMGAGMALAARRRDGTEFPAEISLSAIDTEQGLLFFVAVRDVTDRLEVQAERERLGAAAERLESLGILAGGVAHGFNNLLAVMLNYTGFVAEEVARAAHDDPTRWQAVINDIQQVLHAGERATELTHQLLAFGRREVLRPQTLNLNVVVAEVEQLLSRTLGGGVRLHTRLAGDLRTVLADPSQMEQVLVSLAVNARDAMPDGGTLTIDTANQTVNDAAARTGSRLRAGAHVELRVSDTGMGMSPEVAERVFEPFFTTKPNGDGSGLGLATVYGIVTHAGGHIEVQSVPEAGTTFTILLPATDQTPVRSGEPERVAPSSRGSATILVVEDEEALREATRRILARNGYEVATAAGGPEALKIADETDGPIDLLLTDVMMPHMLGKELARRMQEQRPEIGVIYMSGYAQPVLASRGTLDPGVVLVQKPFTEAGLLDRIRAMLDPGATS